MTVLKAAGLVVALTVLVMSLDDLRAVVLYGALTAGLAVLVARDLLVPVRLAADRNGVTAVWGFAAKDRIAWTDIERVTVDVRHRYGRRWEHLEIDVGDRVYIFTSTSLGVPCTEAAAELREMKMAFSRHTPE